MENNPGCLNSLEGDGLDGSADREADMSSEESDNDSNSDGESGSGMEEQEAEFNAEVSPCERYKRVGESLFREAIS